MPLGSRTISPRGPPPRVSQQMRVARASHGGVTVQAQPFPGELVSQQSAVCCDGVRVGAAGTVGSYALKLPKRAMVVCLVWS
jgi:hypothetical protein